MPTNYRDEVLAAMGKHMYFGDEPNDFDAGFRSIQKQLQNRPEEYRDPEIVKVPGASDRLDFGMKAMEDAAKVDPEAPEEYQPGYEEYLNEMIRQQRGPKIRT